MPTKYPNCRKRTIGGHTYWVARLCFPRDPVTGRRDRPKEFSAKTAAEAVERREAYRKNFLRNPKADRKTLFGPYLSKDFILHEKSRYENGELSWGRYQARKSRLERLVINHPCGAEIVNKTLSDLSPELFEAYFERLLRNDIGGGLRNTIRQDLHLALRKCRRKLSYPLAEFLADMPLAAVEGKPKDLFDPQVLLTAIQDESRPIEARAYVAFEFVLNCRPGEMFALRWRDINWQTGTLRITKAVAKVEHGFAERETTKTGRKGDREIPMGPILAPILRTLQKGRLEAGMASEYVFCTPAGLRMDKDTFRSTWERIKTDLALPDGPKFYSIKTVGNSYALANGVTTAAQAKKMGHTSTYMADNTYRNVSAAEMEKAVEVYGKGSSEIA